MSTDPVRIQFVPTAERPHRFAWQVDTATGSVFGTARSYGVALRAADTVREALAEQVPA